MERPVKYLLGIDQGATQTTAVVVNELGEMIEKNSAQLPARISRKKTLTTDASRAKTTEFFFDGFLVSSQKSGETSRRFELRPYFSRKPSGRCASSPKY
jgi:hypothetical protein